MKRLLGLFMGMVLILSFGLAANAEDVIPEGGTLAFYEDFENGNDTVLIWDESGGTMEVAEDQGGNHVLECITTTGNADNGYFHATFGPIVSDYDYTLRLRPSIKNPDYNWIKICVRCHVPVEGETGGENECYMMEIWEWRATATIKSTEFRQSEPNIHDENQDFYFENDQWYDIKVEVRGTTMNCYVNGELSVSLTDENNFFPSGNFALCSWGANFAVDDLKVVVYE